ncbi:uncharacterized protein RJT20DRAFT_125121 [Scheffersomyces xylosifermentans]|uniref:uncharacterized protein n=1 Tax=Scheffersomyces xylosifermentans TaxID=1304137 RepID=UPI00315D4109
MIMDITSISSLADSHCHLGVECSPATIASLAHMINNGLALGQDNFFHIMTTYHLDLELLDRLLDSLEEPSVVPYYGVHPWYSHIFSTVKYDCHSRSEEEIKRKHYGGVLTPAPPKELLDVLPLPIYIDDHLARIMELITKHSRFQYGIGEIGLDKLFRIPTNGYFGNKLVANDGDTKLSNCKVTMAHQAVIFEKQLDLANRLQKQVSVHCVKAHGLLYEIVHKYPQLSAIILHSYSGSVDQANRWIREHKAEGPKLYFSFSNWINGTENKREVLDSIVHSLEEDQILIETDVSVDQYVTKGNKEEYFDHLRGIFEIISKLKAWDKDTMRGIIRENMFRSIS